MTTDSSPLNEAQALARERLVLLCQKMLNGELSFVEGAIQAFSLRANVGVPESDPDLLSFVAIVSETDHLPASHVQQHWSSEALQRLQPEFEEAEVWAKGVASEPCKNIIARFSTQ